MTLPSCEKCGKVGVVHLCDACYREKMLREITIPEVSQLQEVLAETGAMFSGYGPSAAQKQYGDDLEQLKKLQEAITLYYKRGENA